MLFTKARIPDDAVAIDDHVVRRNRLTRQTEFCVDHPRRAPGRTCKCLESGIPLRTTTEIDRAEKLRRRAVDLDALIAALLHEALGAAQLRMGRYALVYITLHARQHLAQKGIHVVFRADDAFERVTPDAIE